MNSKVVPELVLRLLLKYFVCLPNSLKECGMGDMNVKTVSIFSQIFSLAASTQPPYHHIVCQCGNSISEHKWNSGLALWFIKELYV